jgi:hypothetical protein
MSGIDNWFIVFPVTLGLYALTFIAGGVYYLEQRVSRIRDQFPEQGMLAFLTGVTALAIGLLMAIAIGPYFVDASFANFDFRMAALVAAVAGVGFWVYRIYLDRTPLGRVRDGSLAFICAAIVLVAIWWVSIAKP